MDTSYRSRRAELASLRAELHAKDAPVRQIAQVIQARYNLGPRAAYRYAHGLTQQQVADHWNQLQISCKINSSVVLTCKYRQTSLCENLFKSTTGSY